MSNEIAILGAGMHPWGKWGHNFVQYGVAAAREALSDAGVPWQDVSFVSGGATIRCGYPGYVAGATFAQALGWQGAEVNTSYAACASGGSTQQNPCGRVRCCAGRGRRHHAKGLPGTSQGLSAGGPGLGTLLPRYHEPDLFRSLRPPEDGSLRRHPGGFCRRESQELAHRQHDIASVSAPKTSPPPPWSPIPCG